MKNRKWWKGAQLLSRNMSSGTSFKGDPFHLFTARGTGYDLYEPNSTSNRTLLLVYGMTLAGEKEIRLVHFARVLASSGFQVIVPCLPGLKGYTFDLFDLERLADLIASVGKEKNGHLGIVGFSAGGSMSLVVASRAELTDLIDVLLLFSPFSSLPDAWENVRFKALAEPIEDAEWDHFIWCTCVLAYIQRNQLHFQGREQAELEDLLRNYCTGISAEEKRAFYNKVLRNRDINSDVLKDLAPQVWDGFSPRGKLASLKGRVMILHDPHDPWAPPWHSEEIMVELQQRGKPNAQKCLVSPLISHVTPRYLFRLNDIFYVIDMISELY